MTLFKSSNKFLTIILLLAAFISCKDDNEPSVEIGAYKLLTAIPNTDGQTQAFYLQALSEINQTNHIDNSKAVEIHPATSGGAYIHNGHFYFNDYFLGNIEKWDVNASGQLFKAGAMSTSDLGFAGNMIVKDETTAFVGASNVFKIAIFNPATMQRTGFIDLGAYSKIGEVSNYPEDGSVVNAQAIPEIIIRGNFMYAAIFYFSDFSSYTPAKEGCYIIVIDLTKVNPNDVSNEEAVVKEIWDERGSFTGSWNSGFGSKFMILDEKDDIYVLCHNMWAGHRQTTGKPASVLRIPSGSHDFDNDYYYNLEEASQGEGNSVMGLEYHKNGKFYAAVMDPTQIDPENPYSYYVDPIFKWWQFDLYNPSSGAKIIETDTYCKGASATNCFFEGNYAYIPFVTNTENSMLQVDINTLQQEKLFSANGTPFLFK